MAANKAKIIEALVEKECLMCRNILPKASFGNKKASKDGLQPYCKQCFKEVKNAFRTKQKSSDETYSCSHCDKIFMRKDSLTRHI